MNEHVQSIYEEGELAPEATIRKFRIVQEVSREDAVAKALAEYEKYETRQLSVPSPVDRHFLEAVTKVRLLEGDRHQNGTQRDTKRKRSKKKDGH